MKKFILLLLAIPVLCFSVPYQSKLEKQPERREQIEYYKLYTYEYIQNRLVLHGFSDVAFVELIIGTKPKIGGKFTISRRLMIYGDQYPTSLILLDIDGNIVTKFLFIPPNYNAARNLINPNELARITQFIFGFDGD